VEVKVAYLEAYPCDAGPRAGTTCVPIRANVYLTEAEYARYRQTGVLQITVSPPERPLCPSGCGCRVGPDENGDFEADHRDCSCDGQCTAIPLERRQP